MNRKVLATVAFLAAVPALIAGATAQATTAQPDGAAAVAAARPAAIKEWPLVNKGDKGADVTTIQYLLTAHGYTTDADGDFGGGTEDKVIQFQKANGLTGDGDVGQNT